MTDTQRTPRTRPTIRVLHRMGEPDESPDRSMCRCGHTREAHEFSDDGTPLVDSVLCSGCDECWDCVTGFTPAKGAHHV